MPVITAKVSRRHGEVMSAVVGRYRVYDIQSSSEGLLSFSKEWLCAGLADTNKPGGWDERRCQIAG